MRSYGRALSFFTVLMLLAAVASAQSSAAVQPGHFNFTKGPASVTLDASEGLRLRVGSSTFTCVRVGDNVSGNLVVITSSDFAAIPYTYANGSLQMDEGRLNQLLHAWYEALPPGSAAALGDLSKFIQNYAAASRGGQVSSGRIHGEWTSCQAYQAAAIGSFVACPGSFGLGCGAGVFFLVMEVANC